MRDIDGITRSENGEGAGIVKAGGVRGTVLDLEVETDSISSQVCEVNDGQFTFAPVNAGREPEESVMVKEFSGKGLKTPRGSLSNLRVSSPVLVMIVVIFRFSNPSTSTLGVEILRDKPGAAETTAAEATRAKREARRGEESIAMKTVKAIGEATSLGPWGWTSLA